MADSDVVQVQGPDGQTYHFPKGTDKSAAIAYFKKKGIGVAAPATQGGTSEFKAKAMLERNKNTEAQGGVGHVYPGSHQAIFPNSSILSSFSPSNIADQVGSGVKSMLTTGKDIGKDLLSNPNWAATMPKGQRPSTMQKFVTEPAKAEIGKAKQAFGEGHYSEAAGHGLAGMIPLVGPMAAGIGEQAGRGDVGGAVGQAAGMVLGGKVMKDTGEMVVDKATGMISPESLRQRAAKLDTKVLRTAEAGAKGYKLQTGLQVAKEGIIGTLKSLPDKIEAKRSAKNTEVQSLARQLDAQGTTIDISKEIGPITHDIAYNANQRGTWTAQLKTQVSNLLKRVTTETDMQTGAVRPRNLSSIKISDALALQKGLEDLSVFGKQAPEAINQLARRLRGAIGDKLGKASPEMQKLRGEESSLIKARDAARKNYADVLNGGRTMARGFIYSNMPAIAVYLGLKGLGMSFGPAIGSIVVLRTLAESTTSRTARAAFYAKAADAIDAALGRNTRPQGAPQPGTAIQPRPGGTGPQVPPNARLAAAIGTPQAAAAAAPVAPATVVSTNPTTGADTVPTPTPLTRGTMLPERATRARAGSGDYVKGDAPKQKAASSNVAESNTKTKAMMDRLDNLYERRDSPKSGADRNAIEREIAEIKRVLSGEAKGADASAINKRIADRERLSAKRATAKAETPGTQTGQPGSTVEPAARSEASPENRAVLLDMGYKKLATYDGGPEMVKALRDNAKQMQKIDPSYDEVTALADALQALKEVSGQ